MLVLGRRLDARVRSAESRSIDGFEVDLETADGQRRELFAQIVWLDARSHERAENHVAARPRETIEVKSSHLLISISHAPPRETALYAKIRNPSPALPHCEALLADRSYLLYSALLSVMHQFEITPKALANVSPGLERSDNPGYTKNENRPNPERVNPESNPFRVQ